MANPLVSNGTKLLPSVTRVFSGMRDFHVLFHAYHTDAAQKAHFIAYLSVFEGHVKVFDSAAIQVDSDARVVPFEFTVPAGSLRPGRYEAQVAVLELGSGRARFHRSPFVVVP